MSSEIGCTPAAQVRRFKIAVRDKVLRVGGGGGEEAEKDEEKRGEARGAPEGKGSERPRQGGGQRCEQGHDYLLPYVVTV